MGRWPGLFIVFEGPDGVGKSTQARLLAEWLKGTVQVPVILTREPGGTKLGEKIRQILLDATEPLVPAAEVLLFHADRAQHWYNVILPVLNQGGIVICDRFVESSRAYQGAGRGWAQSILTTLHSIATEGAEPDITFVLLGSSKRTMSTVDRFESTTRGFFERVQMWYRIIVQGGKQGVVGINADRPVETVHYEIKSVLMEKFGQFLVSGSNEGGEEDADL